MRKIYLHHIIEDLPFLKMDKHILRTITSEWKSLVNNEDGILINQAIETSRTPCTYCINDYKPSQNKIISTFLKQKENIDM